MRGLGTDLAFYSHYYGDGKIPTNQKELEAMTTRAAKDQMFNDKRQEWSNMRTAGKFQNEGVAADDPSQLIIYDPKRGIQYRGASAGDTLNQTLSAATTEESGSLAVYRDLYNASDDIKELFTANLTGPFQGNINRMAATFKDMPEYTTFKAKADRLRTIVYGFSGKQINETELDWLKGILPQIYNPDANFLARLESIQEWVADKQEAQLIEMRNARKFTGTSPLRTQSKPGVSDEQLKAFREEMDKTLGGAPSAEPKRIRIKVGPNQ